MPPMGGVSRVNNFSFGIRGMDENSVVLRQMKVCYKPRPVGGLELFVAVYC